MRKRTSQICQGRIFWEESNEVKVCLVCSRNNMEASIMSWVDRREIEGWLEVGGGMMVGGIGFDRRVKDFLASSANTCPKPSIVSQSWYLIENVESVFCHSFPQEGCGDLSVCIPAKGTNIECVFQILIQSHWSLEWRWFNESSESKEATLQMVKCSLWLKYTHVALDTTGMR